MMIAELEITLSINHGILLSKMYDMKDNFNFKIVNIPFLDGYFNCSDLMVFILSSFFCKSMFKCK